MNFRGLSLATAMMLISGSGALAQPGCPAEIEPGVSAAGMKSMYKFRYVSFFDGEPSEMVNLAPNDASSGTVLDQTWQFTHEAGRQIVMVCRYHGTEETQRVDLAVSVSQCKLEGLTNGAGEIVGSPKLTCE